MSPGFAKPAITPAMSAVSVWRGAVKVIMREGHIQPR
jgi:hypothetical protein